MPLDPTLYLAVDASEEPELPEDTPLSALMTFTVTAPRTSPDITPPTFKISVARMKQELATTVEQVTAPPAPTFINFLDTDAGGSVRLVPAPGVPMPYYRYKLGVAGEYAQAPVDGLIAVGNFAGQVFAYSVAFNELLPSPLAASPAFTLAPTAPLAAPPPPTFAAFSDTDAGGSLQVIPAAGVPLSEYKYKIGAGGTYAPVPEDGIIAVGNVNASVYAYSQAGPARLQSTTAVSTVFTAYSAPATTYYATTQSYTTTPQDFADKCGAGTSGTAVTKLSSNGTSTTSQAEANAQALADAKAQALAAIVCQVTQEPDPGPGAVAGTSYHGALSSPTPSNAEVLGLAAEQWADAPREITFSADGTHPAFAEPASYGVRTPILDGNNFDVTADITRSSLTLNGLAYYLYVHNNEQYDPAFKLKF